MVDKIPIQKAVLLAGQIKSQALTDMLKTGPRQGTVLSQEGGKAQVDFGGKKISVDVKGMNLQSGQTVLASLKDGKIVLQILTSHQTAQTEEKATIKTLTDSLKQLGLKGTNIEILAKAMVQAGLPLDKTVLKELAQVLPQINSNQLEALQIFFSRGLPITSSVVNLFAQFLQQRRRVSENLNKLLPMLAELDQELRDIDDDLIQAIREQFGEQKENLQQYLKQTKEDFSNGERKNITKQIQSVLQSLESMLNEVKTEGFEVSIRRIIQELHLLREQNLNEKLLELIDAAIKTAENLQNSQAVQHVKNIPLQGEFAPVVYFQIPYMEQGQNKEIEIRYKKESEDHSHGTLDLRIEMSHLGAMHLNFLWRKPFLSLLIIVGSEDIKNYLEPFIDELQMIMKDKGIDVQSIQLKVDEIPETLEEETPISAGEIKNLDIHI